MIDREYLFTSESVSEGHPDKLADRISDAVLDHVLGQDATAKVACETFIADGFVVVAGEFRTDPPEIYDGLHAAVQDIVRRVLRDTGYDASFPGIDPETCEIVTRINQQSADITQGVVRTREIIGAGDQGLMFGFACDETEVLMPLPVVIAHKLVARQAALRKSGELDWLRPDAKSQVTVRYRGDRPLAVETVVLSTQHAAAMQAPRVRELVREHIIEPVIPAALRSPEIRLLVNPTGRFVIGGPCGDTGLTGRKIIVDTYGGRCPHGGGAFSGKDPTKVDRSATYMARYLAKNIVAAGLARRCMLQLAYAIGEPEPVSLYVDTQGTGTVPDSKLETHLRATFDLTPAGIINTLDLRRPIYEQTAAYGHFGRALPDFTWESTERVDQFRKLR